MAIPRDEQARRYYRVAYQRLNDGQLILKKLNRPTAAVYLTGYAVECILKALVLTMTPMKARNEMLASFRGGKGHDLKALSKQTVAVGGGIPNAIARELAYVAAWSPDLRYDPSEGNREEAERFIQATEQILAWADERM